MIGETLGGYRLLRLLGTGGMGAVYEAIGEDGRRVAIKVLHSAEKQSGTGSTRRFVREARAAMSIDSPHVVRIVAADTDPKEGVPFIVMEYLRGTDADRLIRSTGALEPWLLVALIPTWTIQVAQLVQGLGRERWLLARFLGWRAFDAGIAALVIINLIAG